jgi:hypothetical protein
MSRVKVVFAGFVAVLTVSALAPSSTMAAGGGWLITGTLLVGSASLASSAFVDEVSVMTFSSTTIKCSASTLTGLNPQIESPNKISATGLIFKECAVTSVGECSLSSGTSIGTLPVVAEVTLDGPSGIRGVVKPKTVTTFATIKLEGANCSETGKVPIKGTASWLTPAGQTERTWQLRGLNVTAAAKELEVGNTAASFKTSILGKLASSLPWSFM